MAFDPNLPLDAAPFRNQFNAQQAHWDTLDNQLAILNPLNVGPGDPLTQDEVQTVALRADDMLAALKAA